MRADKSSMIRIISIVYIVYAAAWIGAGWIFFSPVLSAVKGVFLFAYPGYICLKGGESENRLNIGMGSAALAIALTILALLFYMPLYAGSVLPVLFFICCAKQKQGLKERNEVVGIYMEEEENEQGNL